MGKKNNHSLVSVTEQEIRGSMDSAGNSDNLVSGIIHWSSGFDF